MLYDPPVVAPPMASSGVLATDTSRQGLLDMPFLPGKELHQNTDLQELELIKGVMIDNPGLSVEAAIELLRGQAKTDGRQFPKQNYHFSAHFNKGQY